MTPLGQLEYHDERTLRRADGARYDVLEAVQQLPWVRQLCPFMPHEYAILRNSPEQAWFVVAVDDPPEPEQSSRLLPRLPSSESLLGGTGRPPLLARAVRGSTDGTRPTPADFVGATTTPTPSGTGMVRLGPRTTLATTSKPRTASGGRARSSSPRATNRAGRVRSRPRDGRKPREQPEEVGRKSEHHFSCHRA